MKKKKKRSHFKRIEKAKKGSMICFKNVKCKSYFVILEAFASHFFKKKYGFSEFLHRATKKVVQGKVLG